MTSAKTVLLTINYLKKLLSDIEELIDYIDKRIIELQQRYKVKSMPKVNELILVKMKIKQLNLHVVVGQSEQCCEPLGKGFYLGTSCPKCNQPFRQNLK
jgi:hypothetical protein